MQISYLEIVIIFSTYPWGCDDDTLSYYECLCISTHTPVRVWHSLLLTDVQFVRFQLTHPWGCDYKFDFTYLPESDFNSHTREGVTPCVNRTEPVNIFQLTHPWGCDPFEFVTFRLLDSISTHTPVRVWPARPLISHNHYYFNSHTREGVTEERNAEYNELKFQLTHPWGCDFDDVAKVRKELIFQLTHPWGCDLVAISILLSILLFQLTHPWGCDVVEYRQEQKRQISTHTPVRVWHKRILYNKRRWDFNSHTREGVTSVKYDYRLYCDISTHTPVRVWLNVEFFWNHDIEFQLTHPWGCDITLIMVQI